MSNSSRKNRSSHVSLSRSLTPAAAASAAASLAALRDAGLAPESLGRCALIFAVSDGGVIYTRKFYDQVVREGAGSPLLFPETVYNAPGSHIALMMPNANANFVAFLGLSAFARIPAMLNFSAGAEGMLSACAAAQITTVISSRAFVE